MKIAPLQGSGSSRRARGDVSDEEMDDEERKYQQKAKMSEMMRQG